MIVVSDTSPMLYLLLIDQIELLPQLHQQIFIPEAVRDEMLATGAPMASCNNGLTTLLAG